MQAISFLNFLLEQNLLFCISLLVVYSLSFNSRKSYISVLSHFSIQQRVSHFAYFCKLSVFLLLLIFGYSPWWSDSVKDVISISLHLLKHTLCPCMRTILEQVYEVLRRICIILCLGEVFHKCYVLLLYDITQLQHFSL